MKITITCPKYRKHNRIVESLHAKILTCKYCRITMEGCKLVLYEDDLDDMIDRQWNIVEEES